MSHWATGKAAQGRFDETLGLAYTGYHNRYDDPNPATVAGGNDPSDFDGGRTKLDWQGNIILMPGQTLTLGAEHEYYWLSDSAPAARMTLTMPVTFSFSRAGATAFSIRSACATTTTDSSAARRPIASHPSI